MMLEYPKNYKISSGMGSSDYKIVSFDMALIDAGVANYNLVRVSSILPIQCKKAEVIDLKEGAPLLTAYATISSDIAGEKIASAVGIGIPEDEKSVGVIMEYSGKCSKDEAESIVRKMVQEAMGNHGIVVKKIVSSAIEKVVESGKCSSVVSYVAMW